MRGVVLYCVILMSLCCVNQIFGFIPNHLLNIILNLDFTPETVDHTQITENALLEVVRELLLDNPNPDPEIDSTSRINSIESITADNLILAYYRAASVDLTQSFINAIEEITSANSRVDLDGDQREDAAAHFDSEKIQAGHNRLVKLKQMVINEVESGKYEVARVQAGCLLHTLQDFYSHTNWVEMGNTIPYDVLGNKDKNPDIVVAKSKQTCSDCERDGEVNFLIRYLNEATHHYVCENNIFAEINNAGQLTSGYYAGQVDDRGKEIEKPEGKCSHGGFLDKSSDFPATGGINKDSLVQRWSPHANLHSKAVSIATMASVSILNDIKEEVNNDEKFASFLNIALVNKQQISSIAYVIDTTGSMSDELPEIQATLPTIRMGIERYIENLGENAEVNLILVPFNDPDIGSIFTTNDIDAFLDAIAALRAEGGGDCPEPSIGATIRAIRASERGSPIFVFTDAGPSDPERETEFRALIADTGVQISYFLTGFYCTSRRRRSPKDRFNNMEQHNLENIVDHSNQRLRNRRQSTGENIYSSIAAFSGGQVLNVQTSSISELASVIFLSSELSFIEIFKRTGTESISSSYSFPVDNTISVLVITLNGYSINSTVRTPGGTELSSLDPNAIKIDLNTSNSYIATVNVTSISVYGLWELQFSSSGVYSIQVSGLSSLGLSQQLYQLDAESHFGFSSIEGNPMKGQTLLLFVSASGNYSEVELNKFDVITSNGSVHQQFNLTKIGEKSYGSIFTPTLDVFQLALTGVDSEGNQLRRISGTGVQISDVDLRLGEDSYHYNSLYPGDSSNITLVLSNFGDPSTFQISISHGNINSSFSYYANNSLTMLNQNETVEIVIVVTASVNASNGDIIQFIVTAFTPSTADDRSNYVSFQFIASTIPPPEFTENITATALKEAASVLLLMFVLAIMQFL